MDPDNAVLVLLAIANSVAGEEHCMQKAKLAITNHVDSGFLQTLPTMPTNELLSLASSVNSVWPVED